MNDLHATAAQLGHHVWIERRLFEVLGGWVQRVEDVDATLFVAEQSRRHGWHAEVWFERLPELSVIDPEELVVAPSPSYSDALDLVADRDGTLSDVALLAGSHRVLLPHLIARYDEFRSGLGAVADASVIRWMEFILADSLDAWRRGQTWVLTQLDSPQRVEHVQRHQAAVESLLVTP